MQISGESQAVQPISSERLKKGGNNFDFLRLLLASLVIFGHSSILIDGNNSREPLSQITPEHLSMAALAVNGFFILSGFLVLQSWLKSRGILDYFKKRVLRIYPGYMMACCVSIFLISPFGAANISQYLPEIFNAHYLFLFFKRVITLRMPAHPGIFEGLAYPSSNGAIWTVRYEFCCYVFVVLLGLAGIYKKRGWLLVLTAAAYVVYVIQYQFRLKLGSTDIPFLGVLDNWPRFATYFGIGMCFYLYRDKFKCTPLLVATSIGFVIAGCFFVKGSAIVLPVFGTYLLFCIAFSKAIPLQHFGKFGDYSYGVFLYGWPVQTLLIWYFQKQIDPALLSLLGFAGALLLAFASWHLIEKPFLRLKGSPV